MTKKSDKILLPDNTYVKREYDNAIVMEESYQKRYEQFVFDDTRESAVFAFILMNMNENNELICSFDDITDGLKEKGTSFSHASVARAVKIIKEKYSDLVVVDKIHGVSKFIIPKDRCFKA